MMTVAKETFKFLAKLKPEKTQKKVDYEELRREIKHNRPHFLLWLITTCVFAFLAGSFYTMVTAEREAIRSVHLLFPIV